MTNEELAMALEFFGRNLWKIDSPALRWRKLNPLPEPPAAAGDPPLAVPAIAVI